MFAQPGWRGEPVRALGLTWLLTQLVMLGGTIDVLAPIMTTFFCLTFCVINLTCFLLQIASEEFRPDFQMHSWWTSLLGSVLSLAATAAGASAHWMVTLALTVGFSALLWQRRGQMKLILNPRTSDSERQAVHRLSDEAASPSSAGTSSGRWGLIGQAGALSPAARMKLRQSQTITDQLLQDEKLEGVDKKEIELRVQRAAAYIRDALVGRFSGAQWAEASTFAVRLKLKFHRLKFLRMGVMIILVSVSFVEQPSWCYGTNHCNMDTLSQNGTVPVSGFPVLPVEATQLVESICLTFLVLEMLTKYRYKGAAVFWAYRWYYVQIVLLLCDVAGVFLSWINPTGMTLINPVMRPLLFVAMSRHARNSWAVLFKILPSFIDVAVLLILTIFVFSVAGVIMFEGTEEGRQFFPSILEGALNLQILLTTSNFPDVMMPAYSDNWLFSIFFVGYLIFTM